MGAVTADNCIHDTLYIFRLERHRPSWPIRLRCRQQRASRWQAAFNTGTALWPQHSTSITL